MTLTLLPVLYAETHFRLPFLFNLLFKKEPEILADVPFRLTLPQKLPVLILLKDADFFPAKLRSLTIFVDARRVFFKDLNLLVKERFKELIFEIDVSSFSTGWHEIEVKISFQINDKQRICFADNYRSSGHQPFQCYFAKNSLPKKAGFYAGDFHSHSHFTEDQIEFGASLQAMKIMARAAELDFFCVTDHSYDLDDQPNNYLKNDPNFPKWKAFLAQVKELNEENSGPLIIPGEEISVRNSHGQTVHLLALNNPALIPGSGDSGERWLKNKSELTIEQALNQLNEAAIALPAHPAQKVPITQQLFINRGPWRSGDLLKSSYAGLQFINGGTEVDIEQAIKLWSSLLLKGIRILPAAGNDAHGHFNRCREIAIPFVNVREHKMHIFARWRTLIFCPQPPNTPQQILAYYQQGRVCLTNGPFLEMIGFNGQQMVVMGQQTDHLDSVAIELLASKETGFVESVQLIGGYFSEQKEQIIWQKKWDSEPLFEFSEKISLPRTPLPDYIRVQAKTKFGLALTNCIWIKH
ncbi:MAG: PHP domain-containing protein [Caldisericaceae bacterium]|nr:PHP domain-containing protein [Caldisericaceae bacterium]